MAAMLVWGEYEEAALQDAVGTPATHCHVSDNLLGARVGCVRERAGGRGERAVGRVGQGLGIMLQGVKAS